MCEPLTIASLALSGGSVLAGMAGNNERESARDATIRNETARSGRFENQSSNLFQQTLPKASKPVQDQKVADEAGVRTAQDVAMLDGQGNFKPATGSAPVEVGQSIARAGQAAITRGKQQAKLNADVSATAGVNQKTGIDIARDGQWQNIFGGNIRRSAALLPLELQEANQAGSGMRGVGQILSAGAGAAGSAGMAAGAPTWGSLFGEAGAPLTGGLQGPTQGGFFTRMFQ